MFVHLFKGTVALKLSPATVCHIRCIVPRLITVYSRCRTLPQRTVSRIPAGTVFVQFQVAEEQIITVYVYTVKEQTACPGRDAAAESQRLLALTLYESVRTRSTESRCEVIDTLFRIAALKQTFLT